MVASRRDGPVGPAAGPGARAARAHVERIVRLFQFAQRCEGCLAAVVWSYGNPALRSPLRRPVRDRLAVANAVLEFLRLPRLDAGHLPPVRYRKQAGSLTERYVDLVRSAMSSPD